MSQSPTVPCQQIKHLDNSSPIADLVSFGSVTRRFGQYSEVNSSIHLYVVLGASHKIRNRIFYRRHNGNKMLSMNELVMIISPILQVIFDEIHAKFINSINKVTTDCSFHYTYVSTRIVHKYLSDSSIGCT